jgi:hypothetical protein
MWREYTEFRIRHLLLPESNTHWRSSSDPLVSTLLPMHHGLNTNLRLGQASLSPLSPVSQHALESFRKAAQPVIPLILYLALIDGGD